MPQTEKPHKQREDRSSGNNQPNATVDSHEPPAPAVRSESVLNLVCEPGDLRIEAAEAPGAENPCQPAHGARMVFSRARFSGVSTFSNIAASRAKSSELLAWPGFCLYSFSLVSSSRHTRARSSHSSIR